MDRSADADVVRERRAFAVLIRDASSPFAHTFRSSPSWRVEPKMPRICLHADQLSGTVQIASSLFHMAPGICLTMSFSDHVDAMPIRSPIFSAATTSTSSFVCVATLSYSEQLAKDLRKVLRQMCPHQAGSVVGVSVLGLEIPAYVAKTLVGDGLLVGGRQVVVEPGVEPAGDELHLAHGHQGVWLGGLDPRRHGVALHDDLRFLVPLLHLLPHLVRHILVGDLLTL